MTISTSAPRSTIRAIVTGHTRGLGAALAQSLLQRDIEVLGLGRGAHAELASRHPERFTQAVVDLADPAALERWLAGDTLDAFALGAQCMLLFNNAGTVEPIAPLGAQEPLAIARAVTLNVAAPLMLANALAATSSLSASASRRKTSKPARYTRGRRGSGAVFMARGSPHCGSCASVVRRF